MTSGTGSLDGQGRGAYFQPLSSMVRLADGSLLVSDSANFAIRKVALDGTVTTVAGRLGMRGTTDGGAGQALLDGPSDMALAPDGGVYFVDGSLNFVVPPTRLRHLAPNGTVSTLPAPPSVTSVAVASDGAVVLAASNALYRWAPGGSTLIAGQPNQSGTNDGPAAEARFFAIADIAALADGTVYVSEPRTHTLRRLRDGRVETFAGALSQLGSVDGLRGAARLSSPGDLALDASGQLWIAEIGSGRFRRMTPEGQVSTPFGAERGFFSLSTSEQGVAIAPGPAGELYFSSFAGVSRLDATGAVTPIAGQDFPSGTPIHSVSGLGVDAAGNITLAQSLAPSGAIPFFSAFRLTRYPAAGASLPFSVELPSSYWATQGFGTGSDGTVYAGSVTVRTAGINAFLPTGGRIDRVLPDGTVQNLLNWLPDTAGAMAPAYLTVGRDGALYFLDLMSYNLVRWPVGGNLQVLGNIQPWTQALFLPPARALAVDGAGRAYLVTRFGVQRMDNGVLVTLAGKPDLSTTLGQGGTADGQGEAARFQAASAVTVDREGNLYIADVDVIRKVTPQGLVTTIAGTRGVTGLREGALPGVLSPVSKLAVSDDGVLVVVSGTAVVRIRLP